MSSDFSDFDDAAAASEKLRGTLRDLNGLADGFGRSMSTAFKRSVVDGKRLEDVFRSLALSLSGKALNAAFAPLERGLSGILASLLGQLAGAGLARGGGLGPAVARFTGGAGVLSGRGGAASLQAPRALAARRNGGVAVTFNVTTRDAESFRRAEADLTAMLARTVARGQRGM